ncbi:MAG: hypothetical protein ABS46_05665 [Cytophagaceae bacterium SCN 52-12]|nr:MAG: hypothetical protein ABS46_05665 [Cytophagaceae bacterium SCN 52-12]
MKETKKRRILFITPLASRTGSEMMLLNIILRLDRSKYEVAVASYAQGELLGDLPDYVRVYKVPGNFTMLDRISYHLGRHPITTALKDIQKDFRADMWYLNTIVLPQAASTAVSLNIPFVVHFHEMPLSYVYVNEEEFDLIIRKAHHIIGCSEATCLGIRQAGAGSVSLVYSFIEDKMRSKDDVDVAAIRAQFGIAPGQFAWIMSGVPSERKGFDFFPEIAGLLDDENTHLIWVGGGGARDGYISWVENRISSLRSRTRIHLAGRQKEKYDQYLHAADGFILTSRQDPFPLVMIEAAALGKPIVSFPSGGVSELMIEGMGSVTEDISPKQMALEMKKIMNGEIVCDPAVSRQRMAEYDISKGMEAWNRVMDQVAW